MSSSSKLAQDFESFIRHSADYRKLTSADLEHMCSICLNLLTTIPSAREAIFDYFNSLISIGVHCFIQNDPLVTNIGELLTTIETKLVSLAAESNSWAYILAQWSIDQLFNLTIRYTNEAIVKKCRTLEDRIQLWTQCQAAMTLIKICSACILHDERAADNALNKYLEASTRIRPEFDWVTVSFSLRCGQTFISRLIQLSLQEKSQSQLQYDIERIFAVWSSLEVIAKQEPQLFHQALMEEIQILLSSNDAQKHASIISLIRMASAVVTGPLCDIVFYSLYRSLNALSLRPLCSSIQQAGLTDIEQLTDEFISGLARIRTDAFQIIQFILGFINDDTSADRDEIEQTLRDSCKCILEKLCHECHYKFRLHKDGQKPNIPILAALRISFDHLLDLLIYTKKSQKYDLINDLCFIVALYSGDDTMLKYLQYILTTTDSSDLLQNFRLEFEYFYPNCLSDTLCLIFEQNDSSKLSVCLENLLQFVLIDERVPSSSRSIQSTLWNSIDHFNRLLSEDSVNPILILQIFLRLKYYEIPPTYEQILQTAGSFADVHMKIIEECKDNLMDELILWRDALSNFIHFNNHDFHLFIIITMVDFLVPKLSPFDKLDDSNANRRPIDTSNSLLEQNLSISTINSNRVLSRSFKKNLATDRFIKVPSQHIDQYTMLMTCIFNEIIYNDDGHRQQLLNSLATALIDNILPDSVMDLQFDDDQCKAPNEREFVETTLISKRFFEWTHKNLFESDRMKGLDRINLLKMISQRIGNRRNLALIRRLDDQPFVWILLEMITRDHNAFQFCIPLVRCLLSALIVQWENFRGEDKAKTFPKQLNLSTNLVILLKKARYLPFPLNEIYELFSFVTAYDCFVLLLDVWNYLKQNQQTLATKSQQPQQNLIRDPLFFDPIRFVIQKNIADVGHIAEHFLHLQLQTTLSIT